jgi:hypothetical protein
MAKRHTFGGNERASSTPSGRYYGVGVANDSEHGILLANGIPIGPGSPLLLDYDSEGAVKLEAISHHPGLAAVVLATCPAELAALCAPRPAYERLHKFSLSESQSIQIDVPYSGRAKWAAMIKFTTEQAPPGDHDVKVYAGVYTPAPGSGYYPSGAQLDLDELNAYDYDDFPYAANPGDPTSTASRLAHETERGDIIRLEVTSNDHLLYGYVHVWAFDEGT